MVVHWIILPTLLISSNCLSILLLRVITGLWVPLLWGISWIASVRWWRISWVASVRWWWVSRVASSGRRWGISVAGWWWRLLDDHGRVVDMHRLRRLLLPTSVRTQARYQATRTQRQATWVAADIAVAALHRKTQSHSAMLF